MLYPTGKNVPRYKLFMSLFIFVLTTINQVPTFDFIHGHIQLYFGNAENLIRNTMQMYTYTKC